MTMALQLNLRRGGAIVPDGVFLALAYILGFFFLKIGGTVASQETLKSANTQQDQIRAWHPNQGDIQLSLTELEGPRSISLLANSLQVMQDEYFALWAGVWPTSIDWTSAVMGTYVSGALSALSGSKQFISSATGDDFINRHFSQLIASYFGQDAFALRQEAFDDMLWVVLGWIESINFANRHSSLHYQRTPEVPSASWHGSQWIPAFTHRSRIFWDLASQGWNTTLCNGGMIWNPYLEPYKNAITNELFISASISMFLYSPEDKNKSPFASRISGPEYSKPHDPKYLIAAIQAYDWLLNSNMTDLNGLYVDGYHISGWSNDQSESRNTKCDKRNEMVYTYNQGVLLTGQRGLYIVTGIPSYLEEGHDLLRNVIVATGWDLVTDNVVEEGTSSKLGMAKWYGLGRRGVLEEVCDAQAYCSQDAQTFKGIFFHHLTTFCDYLPPLFPSAISRAEQDHISKWHDSQCTIYGKWIKHNAAAALSTRDWRGRFGMWWGAPSKQRGLSEEIIRRETKHQMVEGAVDYRNRGLPSSWAVSDSQLLSPGMSQEVQSDPLVYDGIFAGKDLNDRGRGRTVETQGGGIAVIRAYWEIVEKRRQEEIIE